MLRLNNSSHLRLGATADNFDFVYGYNVTNGVAIASGESWKVGLGTFKALQRVNNAFWKMHGIGKQLYVDGQLGMDTLASVLEQAEISSKPGFELPKDVDELAGMAPRMIRLLADWSIPLSQVSVSPDVLPTDYRRASTPVGPVTRPPAPSAPSEEDGKAGKGKLMLAGLGLLAVGLWFVMPKGRKKSSAMPSTMMGLRRRRR